LPFPVEVAADLLLGALTGLGLQAGVEGSPERVDKALAALRFLDEIGDISPSVQVKLLRLLQEKEYQPLGGTRTQKADVRFIAATHRDLDDMVADGTFCEDLFYRLNVIPIWMPALRERPGDIELLVTRFTATLAADNQRPGLSVSKDATQRLSHGQWPGNVRELMNFIERLVVFTDSDTIEVSDVERELERAERRTRGPVSGVPPSGGSLVDARQDAERQAVVDALKRAGGNRTQAARLLGVSRRKLYNLLADLDIA